MCYTFPKALKEKNENQISMQYFQTFLESLVQVPKQERLIKNEGAKIQAKFYYSQPPLLGYDAVLLNTPLNVKSVIYATPLSLVIESLFYKTL